MLRVCIEPQGAVGLERVNKKRVTGGYVRELLGADWVGLVGLVMREVRAIGGF